MPAEMRDFMVALMMLSNQLKEIAATYNVFISTSTQVNGDGLRPEEKRDQRVLRGSKAIADGVFGTIKIIIVVPFPVVLKSNFQDYQRVNCWKPLRGFLLQRKFETTKRDSSKKERIGKSAAKV